MSNLQFARDESGSRIMPSPKGKGFCPVCEGAMIAKCGDIYRWHWQHIRDRNCDSWKEHETRWHREWKEKFPAECREVVIQDNGEMHIADVLTKAGTVIEFQNSPISAGTILIREAFYDNMVWVINATSFRDNFTIKSTVNQKLWKLDRHYEVDKKRSYDPDWDLADFNRKIKSFTHERNLYKDRAENEQRKLKSLERAVEGLDELVTQVIGSWESFRGMSFHIHGFSGISDSMKADYSERTRVIRKVKADLEEAEKALISINGMEPYEYQGTKYVIADFKDLRPDLIDRCIIIIKADKDTIFPSILKFRSELDFHAYEYKTSAYLFAVDPTKTLDRLNGEIARLQAEYKSLNNSLPDYWVLLKQAFAEFLASELKLNEQRYYEADEKQMEIQSKIYTVEFQKKAYEDELQEEFYRDEKVEKLKYEAEKVRIMKTFKGQYSFVWKRERKSWSDACCPIYFDIGEDYLFGRTAADSLVKISISDFLTLHL